MQDLAELERRINAALQRIGAGMDIAAPAAASASESAPPDRAELDRLKAELAAQHAESAALRAQLAAPRPAARPASELEARVELLTRQIDVQGLELQRMRKNVVQLRENLRALRRAATDKLPDPELINRALATELESIRVTRFAEIAELDEIIAELDPLIAPPSDPLTPEVSEHA